MFFRLPAPLLLLALLLLPISLQADEEKRPAIDDVTSEELFLHPEKHDGKWVRVAGVVEFTPTLREHNQWDRISEAYYIVTLEDADLAIRCAGEPAVVKGDRVRITGLFTYVEHNFVRFRLKAYPPYGKVEKVVGEEKEKMEER